MNFENVACQEEPGLFFPDGPEPVVYAQTVRAKQVCRSCPLIRECLEWVLAMPPQAGIWAATTPEERVNMRRSHQRAVKSGRLPDPVVQDRREKVARMASRGVRVMDISRELGVSMSIVSADLQRIRDAA
jgi:WhiB family redox-sensing transcriptional regulator